MGIAPLCGGSDLPKFDPQSSSLPDAQPSSQRSDAAAADLAQELDEAIASFDQMQADLGYRQAQEALRDLLAKLDLSAAERWGLDADLQNLQGMLNRLEQAIVQIAVFGMVGRGKSSVLNALLGQEIFATGPLHGVTQTVESATWSVRQEAIDGSDQPVLRLSLKGTGQSQIELIDTPGIDEVNGEQREAVARQIARQADLILFVVAGDITQIEYQALSELRQFSKPMVLVFNKVDQYPAADRQAIYETICDRRVQDLLSPNEIVMTAASPLVREAVRREDGTLAVRQRRDRPRVTELKLKILEILQREGKALVALNTMLYADDVNEQIVQRKLAIRDHSANRVIWNGVMTKAVAIALNPITMLDLFSGAIIDVVMILTLSRLYGMPLTQQDAIGLLQKIALSLGGITASDLVATLGLSSLKGMLGLSIPATGGIALAPYWSVAVTQAGVAGVSTYGIGQIAKVYLANGASWGTNGPKAVVSQILASLDEATLLNRIKADLQARLTPRGDRPSRSTAP